MGGHSKVVNDTIIFKLYTAKSAIRFTIAMIIFKFPS